MSGATLLGFLLARIAEDETRAGKATESFPSDGPDAATFRWLGERVVSDCKAKRQTVTYLSRRLGQRSGGDMAEMVLKHLATPYSDHPDYRADWSPRSPRRE